MNARRTVEGHRGLYIDGGRAAEGRRGRWQNGMENVVERNKNVDWAVHER